MDLSNVLLVARSKYLLCIPYITSSWSCLHRSAGSVPPPGHLVSSANASRHRQASGNGHRWLSLTSPCPPQINDKVDCWRRFQNSLIATLWGSFRVVKSQFRTKFVHNENQDRCFSPGVGHVKSFNIWFPQRVLLGVIGGFGWWLIYWDFLVVIRFSRSLAVLSEEDTYVFWND